MKSWMVKAKRPDAMILNSACHPDEGWFFVIDLPLSEIPSRDFYVKKPQHEMGSICPKCGYPMWGTTVSAIFVGCGYCGFEIDWVYAKYRFVWKG